MTADKKGVLSSTYCRVETMKFAGTYIEPKKATIQMGATGKDSLEATRMVRIRTKSEAYLRELAEWFEQVLAKDCEHKSTANSREIENYLTRKAHFQRNDIDNLCGEAP